MSDGPDDGELEDAGELEEEVSRLLSRAREGNESAYECLFQAVYRQLHRIAMRQMRSERNDHTLDASGLVHEAYLRMHTLLATVEDKSMFFRVAANAMRRILVDHARRRNADKRTPSGARMPLDSALTFYEPRAGGDILDLDEALERLNSEAPRQRELVELKFFAELTIPEIAAQLDVSEATVQSDWRLARAKLFRWLKPDSAEPGD